ncbi:MAG: aminotransferase class V-fold PLP-dependent enzyme, partial [Nanoarchaeota archaeon]
MNAQHFPLLHQKKLIYLDSSATSQKPQVVLDAMTQFYCNYNANVHRGIYRLAEQATVMYEQSREVVAQFINALPEEIIFTKGTTESLNVLALSLGKKLQPGEEIVLTEMEHHSNLIPWQQIAKEKQCTLKFIPLTKEYTVDLNKARELITSKTKIVAITHMSNVLGTITPVKEIAEIAHRVHAVLVVDAAQSASHLSLDVHQLDCDFLAFSGHKMYGPTGIGVLYGKKNVLETLEPV